MRGFAFSLVVCVLGLLSSMAMGKDDIALEDLFVGEESAPKTAPPVGNGATYVNPRRPLLALGDPNAGPVITPGVEIRMPSFVPPHTLVKVELVLTGAIREIETTFNPPVLPENIVPDPLDPNRRFVFIAPDGAYDLEVFVIAREKPVGAKGYAKKKATVYIGKTDPRLAMAKKEKPSAADDPHQAVLDSLDEVESPNKINEAVALAKIFSESKTLSQATMSARLSLQKEFPLWQNFFKRVEVLFEDIKVKFAENKMPFEAKNEKGSLQSVAEDLRNVR